MATSIRAAVCRSFGAPLSIETVTLAAPGPRERPRSSPSTCTSRSGTSSVIARDIPVLLQRYQDGELELDGLISRRFSLDQIDEAMDGVRSGTALRNVIVF